MFLSRDQTEVNRVEEFTLAYTEQEHIRVLFAYLFVFKTTTTHYYRTRVLTDYSTLFSGVGCVAAFNGKYIFEVSVIKRTKT